MSKKAAKVEAGIKFYRGIDYKIGGADARIEVHASGEVIVKSGSRFGDIREHGKLMSDVSGGRAELASKKLLNKSNVLKTDIICRSLASAQRLVYGGKPPSDSYIV